MNATLAGPRHGAAVGGFVVVMPPLGVVVRVLPPAPAPAPAAPPGVR